MTFEKHWADLIKNASSPNVFTRGDKQLARLFYYHGKGDFIGGQIDELRTTLTALPGMLDTPVEMPPPVLTVPS